MRIFGPLSEASAVEDAGAAKAVEPVELVEVVKAIEVASLSMESSTEVVVSGGSGRKGVTTGCEVSSESPVESGGNSTVIVVVVHLDVCRVTFTVVVVLGRVVTSPLEVAQAAHSGQPIGVCWHALTLQQPVQC